MTIVDAGASLETGRTIPHWVDGEPTTSARLLAVTDPATGRPVARVAMADQAVVDRAVAVAAAAQPSWGSLPATRRARVLNRYAVLLRERTDELARLITLEHGKTYDDSLGEIERAIEAVEAAACGPIALKGELMAQTGSHVDTSVTLEPLGVCVGITPFNFPAMVPLMQASFAIAAGNAFILKPSEQDPGTAVRLAELREGCRGAGRRPLGRPRRPRDR